MVFYGVDGVEDGVVVYVEDELVFDLGLLCKEDLSGVEVVGDVGGFLCSFENVFGWNIGGFEGGDGVVGVFVCCI